MDLKVISKILGKIMVLEGLLMCAPLAVSIIYQEYNKSIWYPLGFLIPIVSLLLIGTIMQTFKTERKGLYQKEGFAICALVWIIMTVFGALPFVINGDIPQYIDAMFETMSGFTTTGASVVDDVTVLAKSSLFWRSFTHWIGGMGILVFILIFIPESNDGSSLHLLKAESPGPQVGKLASKMKVTARILYLIYLGLTVLEVIFLLFSPDFVAADGTVYKMDLFNVLLASFGSAGTGGFGFMPNSMEFVSPYAQYVIATFLLLFGINFSLYFLILIGKAKEVFKSEELKTYFIMIFAAITIIIIDIMTNKFSSIQEITPAIFEETFRHSYFQVASIITTTGYSTTNYDLWPSLAKSVIVILMLSGAMAGSTGGGIKVSRFVIAIKGVGTRIKKLISPRQVVKAKFEGKTLEENTVNDVFAFLSLYFIIAFLLVVVLSIDPNLPSDSFTTAITSAISCLSNIGPGLDAVGPYCSFSFYSDFSKVILTLAMLAGRLEILPVLILFSRKTWKKS